MSESAFPGALRDWRARRRVSQLELAARAGTTQRHVSFIESGRSAPGRSMVIRLAESLEVPLRERNELLLAAGYAPAYPQTGPELAPVLEALTAVLDGHDPYPAVVVDRHGDLVRSNAAFAALVGPVPAGASVPRLLLDPAGLGARIVNRAEWGWHVVDRLRAEDVRNPDDRLRELTASLAALIPPRPPDPGLGFAVPLRLRSDQGEGELRFVTTLTHFGTATDVAVSELRLEAFLPADRATGEALAR
jgi:transcriptional regulator with XRE-family HTH domain